MNTFAPSSTEIMVAWDRVPEINENGIITTYEVQYEPQTTFDVVVVVGGVLNTSNTSLLLTGLEEFVEYDIIVRAYTSVGPGPFSPTVRIRTLEDGKLVNASKRIVINTIYLSYLQLMQNQPHSRRISRPLLCLPV